MDEEVQATGVEPGGQLGPPPVVETPSIEPSENKGEKDSVREALNQAITEESEKAERARNEKGQFAKEAKAKEKPEAAPEKAAPEESTEKPVEAKPATKQPQAASEPPGGWTQEAKALWASLPPDVQASVLKREKEVSDGFAQYGAKSKQYEPIDQVIQRHLPAIQRYGVQPVEYIDRLALWDQALTNNPQQAFPALMQAYGFNPSTNPQSPESQPDITAQLPQLIDQRVRQAVAPIQSEMERAKQELTAKEITTWAQDKPHFEKVKLHMGQLMQAGAASTLDEAYQQATWANQSIREELMKSEFDKKLKAEQDRAAKAAKAAVSTPGRAPSASPGGQKPNGKDDSVRADLMRSINEVQEKRA